MSQMKMDILKTLFKEKTQAPDLTRGYFENLTQQDGRIIVSGWMLCLTKKIDFFTLYINQTKVDSVPVTRREDVAKVFPFIRFVSNTGFLFSVPWQYEANSGGMVDIRVAGIADGKEVAQMETWFFSALHTMTTPPPQLIERVAAHNSPTFYLVTGLQSYREYWTTICKHKDPRSIRSMLDWGCGCGRVTAFFLKFSNTRQVHGCDIDAQAVQWCLDNLKPAEFSVISPFPPTAYADNSFDLIISFSIFTHLTSEVQLAWLQEMRRILSPGGLFLTSVHGEFATSFAYPGDVDKILQNGIYDNADHRLDGIAPEGYYRGTFQKKEYTLKEWSPYFEILEYGEGKALYYQDLVVMKKR